jgi:hypothetical protein
MADYRRRSLEKRLSPESSGFVKSSASWSGFGFAGLRRPAFGGFRWKTRVLAPVRPRRRNAHRNDLFTNALPMHQGEGSVVSSLPFSKEVGGSREPDSANAFL